MKKLITFTLLYGLILTVFTSCEVVEVIFKTGMGVGIIIVLAIVVLLYFIIKRFSKKE